MTAEFTLILHSFDSRNAEGDGFLDFRAAVVCRGFTGQTAFSFARRDFDAFIADVTAVQVSTRDSALLIGGWDDAFERLRLRIAPAGAFGHFLASVRIADTGPRTDQWHRLETEFVTTPAALGDFVGSLQRLAAERHPGVARLAGDPDAIA